MANINMTTKIQCSFCKEEGHVRVNKEGELTCPTLKTHLCTYCKKTGHTNKRCPVAKANHLAKQQITCTYCKKTGHRNRDCPAGQATIKAKEKYIEHKIKQIADRTYSGITMAKISPEEEKTIEDEDREIRKMLHQIQQEEKRAKKEKWEAEYPGRMEAYHGSFWMFYVYGTKYDNAIAEPYRDVATQTKFLEYLETKYPEDWMNAIIGTRDFCPFVEKLIQTILEENVRATMIATKEIMDEKKKLESTLTPEELEAHLGATTDEFMAELGTVEVEWKKAGKKKVKKQAISDI